MKAELRSLSEIQSSAGNAPRWSRPRLTSLKARRRAAQLCLQALAGGATLRAAAGAAGLHVATVCRWRYADPSLEALFRIVFRLGRQAHQERLARQAVLQNYPVRLHKLVNALPLEELQKIAARRPRVAWSRCCPLCGHKVVVRSAAGGWRFWRCRRWPDCSFASWRPRAPRDCPKCGGPCFWSRSRKSTACSRCGRRMRTNGR